MSYAAVGVSETAEILSRTVFLAGYLSYKALEKLQNDYREAMEEYTERLKADRAQRAAFCAQESAATEHARMLSEETFAESDVDTTEAFLVGSLQRLKKRLDHFTGNQVHALIAECNEAIGSILEKPDDVVDHLKLFEVLNARFADISALTPAQMKTLDQVPWLRADISSSLPESRTKESLLSQLTTLELLAKDQPDLAKQGIALLSQRVQREILTAFALETRRATEAYEVRVLVGDMLSKLQALSRNEQLPHFREQARQILAELSTVLSHAGVTELPVLQVMAHQVNDLYTGCMKALEEQLIAEYLGDQVTDVLLAMGYEVSQIPAEGAEQRRTVRASVEHEVGVEFQVDGDGRLQTETVAFSEEATAIDDETQQHVCALVDEVFAALKTRQLGIRERYRSSLPEGERLRIVDKPEQSVPTIIRNTAPLQMKVDSHE